MMRAIILASVVWSTVAVADETEAEKLYEQGQAAFDAKQFDDALTAWERSYELSKEPGLLFNVAQAYRQRAKPGDCTKALASYQKFITLDASSEQRPVAERFVAEVKPCADREAVIVAPITTTPVTSTPPKASITTTITAPVVDTHPADRTKRLVGLAIVGSGGALAATGLYFGHRAESLGDEVTRACDRGCDWAVYGKKHAEGQRAQIKQYVFGGVGIAAIAVGGFVYWRGRAVPSKIALAPHRDGALLTWSGAW